MYNKGIDMRVLVNGRSVREYSHQGMTFIEARHGTNYTVKVKNDNGYRIMVVLSVDGLDVITGKAAEESNKGYIVDAYSATEIKGYRLSDTDSAAFVFTSKGKSYVAIAEAGDKRNSGVIGVRVFEEKKEKVKVVEKIVEKHIHHHHNNYPWGPHYYTYGYPISTPTIYYTQTGTVGSSVSATVTTGGALSCTGTTTNCNGSISYTSANCASANGLSNVQFASNVSSGNISSEKLRSAGPGVSTKECDNSVSNAFDVPISANNFDSGTSWGKKQADLVKKEYFKRGKLVVESVVYYATREALSNMGIDLTETPAIAHDEKPKAFGSSQYCQPPKGWQG